MTDYLLEIGVEELPASYIKTGEEQILNKFKNFLDSYGLSYASIKSYSTPRRLTVLVEELDNEQEEKIEQVKGPSAKISFDEKEEPTKALQGFMRSQGLVLDDIEIRDGYVYGRIVSPKKPISEIFYKEVPELIKSINFPKNMKWGKSHIRFARPIRWILSVYGDQVLDLDMGEIPVSNKTRGHRFLGNQDIIIDQPQKYEEILEKNFVIVDPVKRRELILVGAEKLAREKGGELLEDEKLLEEITNIVEYPKAILGTIKEEYLELPAIVITTPMKEHLRFIPIYKSEDQLLPYFISVRNGDEKNQEIVIKGNEKVLGARLEDAKFFYNEDLGKSLDDLYQELDGIVYHEKLGTMKLKVDRLLHLVEKIGDQLDIAKESRDDLLRATKISKSDLLTQMVAEFSELQGVMGNIYARKSGESGLVSTAIEEQYLPRYSGDRLPETTIGSILSISDKLDSISAMFAIDMIPTGSQDPLGLRRAAIGIINIIKNNFWNISINESIRSSLYTLVEKNNLVFDYEDVYSKIYSFIMSRLKVILREEGLRYDIVNSILKDNEGYINKLIKKAHEIDQWFEKNDSRDLVEAMTRLNNIAIKGHESDFQIDSLGLEERELYDAFSLVKSRIEEEGKDSNYFNNLDKLLDLVADINKYLDNVLVFVEDEDTKNMRLALLKTINDFVLTILDFSEIID